MQRLNYQNRGKSEQYRFRGLQLRWEYRTQCTGFPYRKRVFWLEFCRKRQDEHFGIQIRRKYRAYQRE